MNILSKSLVMASLLLAGACSTTKTTTQNSNAAPTGVVTNPAPAPSKPKDGIYPPGSEELTAIQVRNPNVTMASLDEGYLLYTKGACINCHGPENIYKYSEKRWVSILDEMAPKAKISTSQKAAVYAYILAIKDTQG
ncbi:MAG TPA: hypothetical protein PKY12_13350, partial [Catalimonadaceae bacterium]|nr:hypothetical protein [Catalimonadaceae bacterium]